MPYDYYITPEEYEIAERNGISARLLEDRVREFGWAKKKAMTTPRLERNPIDAKYLELAKKNGIRYITFWMRMRRGWSAERAATEPLRDPSQTLRELAENRRKIPKEIRELAKENGIKYTTLQYRIRNGWSLVDAATKPLMTRSEIGSLGRKASIYNHY